MARPVRGIHDKKITPLSGTSNGARGTFGSADLSTSAPSRVGKFIIFEGGEGSGKTTIVERMKKEFPDFVYTQDPGGTKLGHEIRNLLMSDKTKDIDPRTELLLFLASRAQMITEIIRPALDSGKTVISNRFALSSIAYQIYGRERAELMPLYRAVGDILHEGFTPDATILLDVTPEIGIQRVHSRQEEPTRFDNEALDFHARVREGYKKHLAEFGTPILIDADKPLEEVWTEVKNAVQSVVK
ncbi:dTMP kinase [Candidatus Kaiserbacteria bacterium CG10_big_fil_rev_8_21_14_0_10_51_14]|uniref:Thymidylate kinase n=1 Tax=Candidatus Kaiserbacteria bacterium CG10_big_fil_rev_8_21_14_0_10_51_14 TaxID=1974610 RepID=A0A2H0UEA5_9BACT|nr:MAG: dTMP kinase [Candidatus Kaiserbacteria bacterium CG10_big_fil_rev_8_21_14_0_10_51_14]